ASGPGALPRIVAQVWEVAPLDAQYALVDVLVDELRRGIAGELTAERALEIRVVDQHDRGIHIADRHGVVGVPAGFDVDLGLIVRVLGILVDGRRGVRAASRGRDHPSQGPDRYQYDERRQQKPARRGLRRCHLLHHIDYSKTLWNSVPGE